MIEITENDKKFVDLVENTVCEYFSVCLSDIASRNHKRDASLARGFIWFILHYEYNLSISKLAKEYIRNRRSITYLIAKIKVSIKRQKMYSEMYLTIKDKLNIN